VISAEKAWFWFIFHRPPKEQQQNMPKAKMVPGIIYNLQKNSHLLAPSQYRDQDFMGMHMRTAKKRASKCSFSMNSEERAQHNHFFIFFLLSSVFKQEGSSAAIHILALVFCPRP
jgi:hypothetical protein